MTPRYEYRVWAPDLTDLAARLAERCKHLGTRTSEETYLVGRRTDVNIKIRAEILDIKQLIRIERGFQLWTPILKEAFPLRASSARDVLTHLGEPDPPPAPRDEQLDVESLLVLSAEAGIAAALVTKHRHGFLLEGCILEFAEVAIDGADLQTVAVESEDLDTAVDVAARLGVDNLPNQSYQTAIRHALSV
jgi:exopolyphosphatase/guanosine-5'-triphosphate,3'-diphosphate pyrophosphatase